jgi:precorrin-4/cobalt-precorrin-4 C11-methyltransferase
MTAERHPILFVGAGPGDPELITVKGQRALESADLVVYAGSLVPKALLSWTREDARTMDSAGMDLEEIVTAMADAWQRGAKWCGCTQGTPACMGPSSNR